MAAPYRSRLARVFDHVTIRVSDLEEARRFYGLAMSTLGFAAPETDGHFFEWWDFSISTARSDRPLTRNLHVALVTTSRAEVDRWWQVMTGAGYRDDGAPGPRPLYSPRYYGAFVLDPDGNSVEAVWQGRRRKGDNHIDHLWIRVRDLAASRRFYETIAPVAGLQVTTPWPDGVAVAARGRHFCLVCDERPLTENVHIAFPAPDNATVDEFHRTAVGAGYRDNGPPGERRYHPGYYGAFVFDPDGNNVEAVCHNR
jgi:catechol 2,3-dioxygenase-like lactoylglutathione lyase family enzyme